MTNHVGNFSTTETFVLMGGTRITGFAEGSMIAIAYDNPAFNVSEGADGEVTRVNSGKLLATATIRLNQSAASNDILSAYFLVDIASNLPVEFALKDNTGRTIGFSASSWIEKMADLEMADTAQVREWTVKLAHWDSFIGGNN